MRHDDELERKVELRSPWHPIETLARDLRFALRSLRRAPIFALTAAAVLGLGIGATTTVFTVVNGLLLRPLPFERADDVVQVLRRVPSGGSGSFSMHDFLGVSSSRGALSAIALLDVFNAGRYSMLVNDGAESITACRVSAQFFDVLGLAPVRGRLFRQSDDAAGAARTAIITEAFWRQRFAANPDIIDKPIVVGGQPYTVIGVVPDAVRAFGAADMYLSLTIPAASADRTNSFQVLGRIAPGVGRPQAEARIDVVARHHAEANPALTNMPQGIVLQSLQETAVAPVRPGLQALMLAVGLVLLIACSNVANLVLARALGRRREMAVMGALGASRWRIVQRVLAETVVVAGAGAGLGLWMAYFAVRALLAWSSSALTEANRIHIDGSVVAFVIVIALVSAVIAGLPPVIQVARGDLLRWVKDGDTRGGTGTRGQRVRIALTVSQIALSTILLAGAALLTRSFWNLTAVDPGFQADGLLTMSVSMTPARYPDSARLGEYTEALTRRLELISGVTAASSTTALPSEFPIDFPVSAPGGAETSAVANRASELDAWYRAINPHYFSAMKIPVVAGRAFDASDSAGGAPVIIVSETLAHAAFPNRDAIGEALVIGTGYLTDPSDLRPRTIVGVVGSTRERGVRLAPTMTMYVPVAQAPERITRLVVEKIPVRWVIRTTRDIADLVPAIRQAVLSVDSTQPPADFARMSDVLDRSISTTRFTTLLLVAFSMLALMLAAIGVYGLTAYGVAQRTHEIGIRLSLGASPAQLVRTLLVQGLRLSVAGTTIGLLGAFGLVRFLRSLLFGVSSSDGPTLVAVVGTMTAVVLAATYVPASRASNIDPMRAMRHE
jgi:putative ABC transport system permease protein